MRSSTRGGCIGVAIGKGALVLAWTGNEFVFGLRWTDECFGLCAGPLMLAWFWGEL